MTTELTHGRKKNVTSTRDVFLFLVPHQGCVIVEQALKKTTSLWKVNLSLGDVTPFWAATRHIDAAHRSEKGDFHLLANYLLLSPKPHQWPLQPSHSTTTTTHTLQLFYLLLRPSPSVFRVFQLVQVDLREMNDQVRQQWTGYVTQLSTRQGKAFFYLLFRFVTKPRILSCPPFLNVHINRTNPNM